MIFTPKRYMDGWSGSRHLELGDYGSCIYSGGTTQPKLLGAYKLSINSALVGMGPGRRVNETQGVDALDVTSAVVKGENCIALQGFHTNNWGAQPRFLLLLRLTFSDGSVREISSGADWHTHDADQMFLGQPHSDTGAWARSGPWYTYGVFPQEMIDVRQYPAGWQKFGFVENSAWQPAAVAEPFVLPLKNKPSRPISVWTRQATKVTAHAGTPEAPCNHCYVIDFGLEMQGGVNLTFSSAKAGHLVTVLLSEELRADGTPLVPMHTGNNFTYQWTLREGVQSVSAHEYVEFRYGMVINAPEPLTTENAGAWVIRYPHSDEEQDSYGDLPALPPRSPLRRPAALATFSSDSVDLNAVWSLVRHTIVATTLDLNTDSNTRQRDLCHTDAFITSLGQLSISNEPGIATMTTSDAFQLDSNIWKGTTDFRAALISMAYYHAMYTGDLSVLRQRYADCKLHSFAYFFNESLGAVSKSLTCTCPASWSPAGMPAGVYEVLECACADLNDWPQQYRDGFVQMNVSTIANSYIALATRRVADIALLLGEIDDAAHYASMSEMILATLRERLYDKTKGRFVDGVGTQHAAIQSQIFPLMAGVVNETESPGMGLAMVKYLRSTRVSGNGPSSCMAAFWLLEGLYRVGWHTAEAADLALDVITAHGQYSWLNMIAQGATCTMETWPNGTVPHSGGTGGTWSHPWCAGPNSAIIRLLVGVRPESLGWKHFLVAPQLSSIRSVSATVPILVGGTPETVKVELRQSAVAVCMTLTVPADTTAKVCLPAPHAVTSGVNTKLRLDGKAVAAVQAEGRMLCAQGVEAGVHRLERIVLSLPSSGGQAPLKTDDSSGLPVTRVTTRRGVCHDPAADNGPAAGSDAPSVAEASQNQACHYSCIKIAQQLKLPVAASGERPDCFIHDNPLPLPPPPSADFPGTTTLRVTGAGCKQVNGFYTRDTQTFKGKPRFTKYKATIEDKTDIHWDLVPSQLGVWRVGIDAKWDAYDCPETTAHGLDAAPYPSSIACTLAKGSLAHGCGLNKTTRKPLPAPPLPLPVITYRPTAEPQAWGDPPVNPEIKWPPTTGINMTGTTIIQGRATADGTGRTLLGRIEEHVRTQPILSTTSFPGRQAGMLLVLFRGLMGGRVVEMERGVRSWFCGTCRCSSSMGARCISQNT